MTYKCYFIFFQIPATLMGIQGVPEGLANVQMDAFERRIKSLQFDIGEIIIDNILKPILKNNNLDGEIEIVWGLPSEEATDARLLKLTTLLQNPLLSPQVGALLEKEVLNVLGFEEEAQKIDTSINPALEVKKEEELEQPEIPGEKQTATNQS